MAGPMPESLDPRLVYARTAAGTAEVSHHLETLSPGARRMLFLIDGRRSLAQLPGHARPGELPKLVEELLAVGLIALTGIVDELPPGWNDARDPRLEDFKQRIQGSVERELGPAGTVLEARLQDCVNMTVMRGVMREIIEMVRARRDDAAASRVSARAQAALKAWDAARNAPDGDEARVPRRTADAPPGDAARRRDRGTGTG
jgi:hypothetical protein